MASIMHVARAMSTDSGPIVKEISQKSRRALRTSLAPYESREYNAEVAKAGGGLRCPHPHVPRPLAIYARNANRPGNQWHVVVMLRARKAQDHRGRSRECHAAAA